MPDELDDLEAVRVIVETLRPFPADDQERIVRCSVVQCSVFGVRERSDRRLHRR